MHDEDKDNMMISPDILSSDSPKPIAPLSLPLKRKVNLVCYPRRRGLPSPMASSPASVAAVVQVEEQITRLKNHPLYVGTVGSDARGRKEARPRLRSDVHSAPGISKAANGEDEGESFVKEQIHRRLAERTPG
ncbi:hypothetical protein EXIGLDRAFT_722704 [Exidia glandulosa HHB12029]|uniref:Uncharacterized protein n=1 Tax=Exidia glandulosa HHB12029 TaxID=1314781 RepID=A0A165N2E3_EXIGL|nr:hypothetical protein EXIGLDRAFT_722704 [Exidia glandulosa HHB12029]